jgi:hypothetical protein
MGRALRPADASTANKHSASPRGACSRPNNWRYGSGAIAEGGGRRISFGWKTTRGDSCTSLDRRRLRRRATRLVYFDVLATTRTHESAALR